MIGNHFIRLAFTTLLCAVVSSPVLLHASTCGCSLRCADEVGSCCIADDSCSQSCCDQQSRIEQNCACCRATTIYLPAVRTTAQAEIEATNTSQLEVASPFALLGYSNVVPLLSTAEISRSLSAPALPTARLQTLLCVWLN